MIVLGVQINQEKHPDAVCARRWSHPGLTPHAHCWLEKHSLNSWWPKVNTWYCPLFFVKCHLRWWNWRGGQVGISKVFCHLCLLLLNLNLGTLKYCIHLVWIKLPPFQRNPWKGIFEPLAFHRIGCCWLHLWLGCLPFPCRCQFIHINAQLHGLVKFCPVLT